MSTTVNTTKRVVISSASHRRLERLAEIDHRTLGGEVEWLIDRRLQECGVELTADQADEEKIPAQGGDGEAEP